MTWDFDNYPDDVITWYRDSTYNMSHESSQSVSSF